MIFIYILLLESNKYYVGKTTNPQFRLDQHFNANGSEWTKLYNPIKLLELIPNCDPFDEDKYTLKYMTKYGIQNTRGGTFCKVNLSEEEIMILEKMIKSSTNKCFKCGQTGHFAKDCDSNTEENDSNGRLYEYVFKWKHHSEVIYDEILRKLQKDEYIIRKILENDNGPMRYYVCYVTNMGNIVYTDSNEIKLGSIGYGAYYDNRIHQFIVSKKILKNEYLNAIMKYKFKSTHYMKILKELNDVMGFVDNIIA